MRVPARLVLEPRGDGLLDLFLAELDERFRRVKACCTQRLLLGR
jgi:hypothetical protein